MLQSKEKKKWEPPPPPPRVGKKQRRAGQVRKPACCSTRISRSPARDASTELMLGICSAPPQYSSEMASQWQQEVQASMSQNGCLLQSSLGAKLPGITPNAKCKLRLLKLERIKDWLLMEEEFVSNQERLKPQEERNEEDRTKVALVLLALTRRVQSAGGKSGCNKWQGCYTKYLQRQMIALLQQLQIALKDHSRRLMSSEDPQ